MPKSLRGFVRALWIADAIERIHNSQEEDVVCEEHRLRTDSEQICVAALDQLKDLIQVAYSEQDYGAARHRKIQCVSNAGGMELCLRSLTTHVQSKLVQVSGAQLLVCFLLDNGPVAHAVSSRPDIVRLIMHNIERFPEDVQVQQAMWNLMFPIQQSCVGMGGLYPGNGNTPFCANLANANALTLAYDALERHMDDYGINMGASCLIQEMGYQRSDRAIAAAYHGFVRNHPNLRALLDQVIETQQRVNPDDIYVHREASLIKIQLDVMGL